MSSFVQVVARGGQWVVVVVEAGVEHERAFDTKAHAQSWADGQIERLGTAEADAFNADLSAYLDVGPNKGPGPMPGFVLTEEHRAKIHEEGKQAGVLKRSILCCRYLNEDESEQFEIWMAGYEAAAP
jgi:hypothetical protein